MIKNLSILFLISSISLISCSKIDAPLTSSDKNKNLLILNCQSKNLIGLSMTITINDGKVDFVRHPPRSDEVYSEISVKSSSNKIILTWRNDFSGFNTGFDFIKMTVDRYTGMYDEEISRSFYKGTVNNITEREDIIWSGTCETLNAKKF